MRLDGAGRGGPAMLKSVQVFRQPNNRWRRFHETRTLSLESKPLLFPGDTVFAMGSCFAREIRQALTAIGITVGPDYARVAIDRGEFRIDELPAVAHLNYYNSFTIRQEFERLTGRWVQAADDFWKVGRDPAGGGLLFQDPYKRLTFGRTPEALRAAVSRVDAVIEEGARAASVFLFTLGMAEVFRKHDDGRVVCQKPAYLGGGGAAETAMHLSTVAENLANLEAVRAMIRELRPDARMVVTVSPVPLERTFSGRDIVVANAEGKAILRAAVGEFARAHDDVVYFPAYEIVTALGAAAFDPADLRHVDPGVVDVIMRAFVKAHASPARPHDAEAAGDGGSSNPPMSEQIDL